MGVLKKVFEVREEQNEEVKPFLDHLEDLRWMLVKMVLALLGGMIVCLIFRHAVNAVLIWPRERAGLSEGMLLTSLSPLDAVLVVLKMCFFGGIVIAFPFLIYFMARFILPALTARERAVILGVTGSAFGLFLFGIAFCYFLVLPQALSFLAYGSVSMGWAPNWTVGFYYAFVTQLTLAFGIAFNLPTAVLALNRLGILSQEMMKSTRAYAIVVIFVLAAFITPTADVISLMSLGIPMVILYEACIGLAGFMERRALRQAEADQDE